MKIEFPVNFGRNVKVGNLGMGVVFLSRDRVCRVIDYGGQVDIDNIPPDRIVVFDLTNTRLTTIMVDEIAIPLDCTLVVKGRSKGSE